MHQRDRSRIGVDYPVTIFGDHGGGEGILSNLTITGAGVLSTQTITGGEIDGLPDIAVGATVRLHIHLTGARKPIDIAVAVVRWKQDRRLGVEFVRFEGDAKIQLQDMLNQSDANPAS